MSTINLNEYEDDILLEEGETLIVIIRRTYGRTLEARGLVSPQEREISVLPDTMHRCFARVLQYIDKTEKELGELK